MREPIRVYYISFYLKSVFFGSVLAGLAESFWFHITHNLTSVRYRHIFFSKNIIKNEVELRLPRMLTAKCFIYENFAKLVGLT